MKKFRLVRLELTNFKGIKSFQLNAEQGDINILGRNGVGKTTLFDAFTWLLFGRDSLNKTNFDIKTLDKDGNVKQHGIDHMVEGMFSLDDQIVRLKRVYRENWQKKRGTAKSEMKGHTTDYYIDEVPVKQGEYNKHIHEIMSDDLFKILSNPLYFNESLDMKTKRNTLLNMVDGDSDSDIANHSDNKDLIELIDKLNGKDVEQHQLTIKSKQKAINDELVKIPIRIDEIGLSLPDTTGLDESEIKKEIETINIQIEEKKAVISNIKSGGEISEYQKKLSDIDMELTQIKNIHDMSQNERYYKLKSSLQEKESNKSLIESDKTNNQNIIANKLKEKEQLNEKVDRLRSEWVTRDKEAFEYKQECSCPACGQDLPEDQLNEAREKAESQFNESKAIDLEKIVKEANKTIELVEGIDLNIEKINKKIDGQDKEIVSLHKEVEKLKKEIEQIDQNKVDITQNGSYVSKLKEKEWAELKLVELRESNQSSIDSILEEIKALETSLIALKDDLNKFGIAKHSEQRLKDLEEQEKKLIAEHEKLEKELFLTEEFIRTKVNHLEEKINSKFKYVKFKLFENQVNGGLKETCETLFDGVPYSSGLNNASKINAGLDIINTLNENYGIEVPIFIDNRESVTDLIETKAQLISLIVDKTAYDLTVE